MKTFALVFFYLKCTLFIESDKYIAIKMVSYWKSPCELTHRYMSWAHLIRMRHLFDKNITKMHKLFRTIIQCSNLIWFSKSITSFGIHALLKVFMLRRYDDTMIHQYIECIQTLIEICWKYALHLC